MSSAAQNFKKCWESISVYIGHRRRGLDLIGRVSALERHPDQFKIISGYKSAAESTLLGRKLPRMGANPIDASKEVSRMEIGKGQLFGYLRLQSVKQSSFGLEKL